METVRTQVKDFKPGLILLLPGYRKATAIVKSIECHQQGVYRVVYEDSEESYIYLGNTTFDILEELT